MEESIDDISQNIMTAYIAQMQSALEISNILLEHNTQSNELSGDDIICGLIYRLMIPMNNTEMMESLEEAKKIMDPIESSESSSDESDESDGYDEIEEKYEKPSISRKIKTNNCNCDICSRTRVCLINFKDYEPKDQLAQRFKDSITETCNIHKIYV